MCSVPNRSRQRCSTLPSSGVARCGRGGAKETAGQLTGAYASADYFTLD
jgi:hypothetical protein